MKKIKNYNEFINEEAAPKKRAAKLKKDSEKDSKDSNKKINKKDSDKPYETNIASDDNSGTFFAIQNMMNQ